MATRYLRSARGGYSRRGRLRSLLLFALGAAGVWSLPTALVLTPLRELPLEQLFAGIDGRVSSGGAAWHWLGTIEYRDVVLADRQGRPLAMVPRAVLQRGLLSLASAWFTRDVAAVGTLQLIDAEVLVEARRGGSTIEDVLAPWLANPAGGPAMAVDIEVIDAAIDLVDTEHEESWRVTDVLAAVTVVSGSSGGDAALAGWTTAGRVQPGDQPPAAVPTARPTTTSAARRLDRTTITAGATAALARDGGWSVSSPARSGFDEPRTLAIATNRLPLGVSRMWATRFDGETVCDGLADIRLDITLPLATAATRVVGSVAGTGLALKAAGTLDTLAAMDRCEIPLDVLVSDDVITIRDLRAISPLFKAEASGRLRIPRGGSWEWAEALVSDDFAIAADIDLAAVAAAVPGGITVRPDVKVTAGDVQLAAAAHPDGKDRLLEVRLTSRDLAAVQYSVDGERPLRWNEPFTAWLRGRRGPARSDRLQIEEARIASPAIEVAASGSAELATAHWTIDLDALVKEAAEVLDLGNVDLAGTARGTLELARAAATGVTKASVTSSLSDFSFTIPGRRPWSDKQLTLTVEGEGSPAGAAWLVDRATMKLVAADDTLECGLTGGAIVDLQAFIERLLGSRGTGDGPFLGAAAHAEALAAEGTLTGDIGRWQARFEAVAGAASGVTVGGKLQASAAVAASGNAWQITRATAEIEKPTARPLAGGWQIDEPRLVASAAGLIDPVAGQVQVSSAEVLTATLSVRTGGVIVAAPHGSGSHALDRVRGKVQWQADVSRLEKWLLPALTAARWPATGRMWGTAEVLDTAEGVNLLVEATGSQLVVAGVPAAAALGVATAAPQPLWTEPEASVVVEITRPRGDSPNALDSLRINRLNLASSTVALAATGTVEDVSTRRQAQINGTISYDWNQVTRLLTPWTGGRVRLVGGGARPFAVRGPLGTAAQLAAGAAAARAGMPVGAEPAVVSLPEDWLTAGGQNPADRVARVSTPVAPPSRSNGLADRLRSVAIDTSTTWTAADVDGFRFEPGEMTVRLFEGQLAFGPLDIGAAGGRIRGAPWIKLLPLPGELIVPPGRLVDRVALSREVCDRWVAWIMPLLGRSTHTEGLVSVDLAGARIPLADPFGGEMAGQVLFERLEVTPGPHTQPLVNLIVRLQSVIDPRFAFGDKTVLMSVRPEPVRVRLADRRLWHEGLVMDTGQLTVKTGGSVGGDGSLAMAVELAFRGDIAGQTPVIAQLLRTPLVIPLRGTVNNPQFDAAQIDTILARIVENTAEAVINDGLSRGLEALFGKPQ